MDCNSSPVIYLATGLHCQGQNVGKSVRAFKTRYSSHNQDIKHKKGGLGKHFGGSRNCSYKDIQFTLIEQIEDGNRNYLSRREVWWQHQLRVYEENGVHQKGAVNFFHSVFYGNIQDNMGNYVMFLVWRVMC